MFKDYFLFCGFLGDAENPFPAISLLGVNMDLLVSNLASPSISLSLSATSALIFPRQLPGVEYQSCPASCFFKLPLVLAKHQYNLGPL